MVWNGTALLIDTSASQGFKAIYTSVIYLSNRSNANIVLNVARPTITDRWVHSEALQTCGIHLQLCHIVSVKFWQVTVSFSLRRICFISSMEPMK